MANKILNAPETVSAILTTELNSLANTAQAVDGADYDNGTNKFMMADFQLYVGDFAAAPTAGGYAELHIYYKYDGTHYADNEEGDAATPVASAASLVGIFPIAATDGPQYIGLQGVPLSPFAFRAAIVNKCGQAFGASGNTLSIAPYNPEVQ